MRRTLLVALAMLIALAWWFTRTDTPTGVEPLARADRAERTIELAELESSSSDVTRSIAEIEPEVATRPRLLRPNDPMALLRVLVVEAADHTPLAETHVTFRASATDPASSRHASSEAQVLGVSLTGLDGVAAQMIDPGVFPVVYVVTKSGRSTSLQPPPLVGGEERDLVVEFATAADCVLYGRVIARDTRAPIPGAVVTLDPGNEVVAATIDGRFRAELRSWRDKGIEVRAPGYGPCWVTATSVHATPETALDIELDRGGALHVTVLDAAGAPIAGALVRIAAARRDLSAEPAWGGAGLGTSTWPRTTGADGIAHGSDLPAATALGVEVERNRVVVLVVDAPIVLTPGEERALTLQLAAPSRIAGIAREESGDPAPSQSLWLEPATRPGTPILRSARNGAQRRRARTDSAGRFHFDDVTPGAWWLGPAEAEFGHEDPLRDPMTLAQRVEVPQTPTAIEVEVQLVRGHVIRGRVVAPDGSTGAQGIVRAKRDGTTHPVTVNTADDGAFVLGPLLPGTWRVAALPRSDLFWPSIDLEVDSGAENVVLRLQPSAELRVRVLGADGAAIPGVDVQVASSGYWGPPGRTGADGIARLCGRRTSDPVEVGCSLPDGRWGIAQNIGMELERATEIDLQLEQGVLARLRCSSAADSGTVVDILHGGGRIGAVSIGSARLAGARPVLATLPVGQVTLRTQRVGEPAVEHAVVVEAGTQPEFTFDGAWR